MTTRNEFDRLLGDWLEEGPRRAPDRPIDLALEHARAHPRRPDLLGFLRPDVMAPRRSPAGLRPALVLAALALIAAAVAIGGGAFRQSAEPPLPAVSASPSASSAPTASPIPARFEIELTVPVGQPQTITVIDGSGAVREAASGTPADGSNFPFDAVDVANVDATTIQLGWSGFPCATAHTLEIDPDGRTMTLTRPPCEGETDAIAVGRIVVLAFSEPVDAAELAVTLAE